MSEEMVVLDGEQAEECVLPRVIFIRATATELLYPFVSFALLKEDPLPDVQRFIDHRSEHSIISSHALIRSAWNHSFRQLSIDQLYFVNAWNSVPEATPRMLRAEGLTFVIMSCSNSHKRWLTSRPMSLHSGELVAWCVEIDMHATPFQSLVTLSNANMLKLTSVFKQAESPKRRVA